MKECLIHVGFEKTGTTSIQESLFLNRSYLLTKGLFFPNFEIGGKPLGRNSCHILQSVTKKYSQIDPFWKLDRSPRDLRNFGVALLDGLIRDFYNSGCSTLLLSSELLPGPYLASLCDILRQDVGQLRGVVYLRAPVPRFRSRFQQALRGGRLRNGTEHFLLQPRITELQDCFPSALTLRRYVEKSEQQQWSSVDDFWSSVLRMAPPPKAVGPSLNEADPAEITVAFAQIAEPLNQWGKDQRQIFFGWCRNAIREMNLHDFLCMRFEFSRSIERRIIAATVSENLWLENEFGLRWDDVESEGHIEIADDIILSAKHLREEVKHSPQTCLAISRHLLESIKKGVPRGVDATAAARAVTSAIDVFSERRAQ